MARTRRRKRASTGTRIRTFRRRIGRNRYLIIKIYQTAEARAASGNALASNALNIQIKKSGKRS